MSSSNLDDKEQDQVGQEDAVEAVAAAEGFSPVRQSPSASSQPLSLYTQSPASSNKRNTRGSVSRNSLLSTPPTSRNSTASKRRPGSRTPASAASSTRSSASSRKPLTLLERRARNELRNQHVLQQLGLQHGMLAARNANTKNPPKQMGDDADDSDDQDDDSDTGSKPSSPKKKRGMLLSSSVAAYQAADQEKELPTALLLRQVQQHYPHRRAQVRRLASYLLSTTTTATSWGDSLASFPTPVPAPVLITGPSGSGKTSVTLSVLQAVQQYQQQAANTAPTSNARPDNHGLLVTAYIPCGVVLRQNQEGVPMRSTLNEFVAAIYREFHCDLERKQRRKQRSLASTGSNSTSVLLEKKSSGINSRKRRLFESSVDENNSRKLPSAESRRIVAPSVPFGSSAATAIHALGRALQTLFGNTPFASRQQQSRKPVAAVLILDHAEACLSISGGRSTNTTFSTSESSNTSSDGTVHPNVLSHLALLPQVFGLQLTIVLITQSMALKHCPLTKLKHSFGTVGSALEFVHIHFPAYKNQSEVKDILFQPNVKRLVVGQSNEMDDESTNVESTFEQSVYRSFVDAVVQSSLESTNNMRELILLGRHLWPKFIAPLSPEQINSTMETVQGSLSKIQPSRSAETEDEALMHREIRTYLNRRILPHIRTALQEGLTTLEFDAPAVVSPEASLSSRVRHHEFSLLNKFLLLSAFICQYNRPDTDKRLFSIRGTGRRRKKSSQNDDAHGEGLAFASSSGLNPLRQRLFPLERLLSVYVSMVGLNKSGTGSNTMGTNDKDEQFSSLGTCAFNESLAHLCDIGILHCQTSSSTATGIRRSDVRYWCSLTRDEAESIAKSIHFPLDRYLL